jgi:hypothetical protein
LVVQLNLQRHALRRRSALRMLQGQSSEAAEGGSVGDNVSVQKGSVQSN